MEENKDPFRTKDLILIAGIEAFNGTLPEGPWEIDGDKRLVYEYPDRTKLPDPETMKFIKRIGESYRRRRKALQAEMRRRMIDEQRQKQT